MKIKFILSLFAILFVALTSANATPIFAEQYKMKCNGCHSLTPTLNKTGLQFLRNGFRFSKDDKPWLEGFLDANSSSERFLPIHGLAGINIDTKSRNEMEKINVYMGGSMTKTLSAYTVTRSTYNLKKNHNLFGESNTRGFLQWNPDENRHVVKLGWMDPLTMFSNADRVLMDNALMGSGLMKKAPKSSKKPSWAKNKPKPKAPGADATPQQKKKYQMMVMPKQPYKLPVPYTGIGLVKGIEYSYLYDNQALFLVNYGIPSSPSFADDSEDSEITTGIELQDIGGYRIGLIYAHQELGNISSDSYILPIEKHFFGDQFLFQTSFVYKDSDQYDNPYYGSQTTFTYQLDEDAQLRTILSIDEDEDEETGRGVSVTYSRSWSDRFLLHITGARHKGGTFDESIAKLSLYVFL
jgi:hypothetical protein